MEANEFITCSHCHKVMDRLAIDRFDKEGDDWFQLVDYTINDKGVIYFETDETWCGYGLIPEDDSEIENPDEELTDTIACPYCRGPVEADYMSIYRPVVVIVWPKGKLKKEEL